MPCKLCGIKGNSFRTCDCPGAQKGRLQSWETKTKRSYENNVETAISFADSVIENLEDDLKEIRSKTKDSIEEKEILRAITVLTLVKEKIHKYLD